MATILSELPAIGHNMPPEPFEAFKLEIESLYEEAANFLDGEGIQNQQQADDVSALLNRLRKVQKDADEARKAEKKPFDDAAKAVQAKWTPLLGKADLAASTAKNALAPFLRKQEEQQQRAAEAARMEAERQAEAARQAAEQAAPDDLAGQATARVLQENAAELQKQAEKLDKAKAHAKGGERAIGLRSYWRAEITDPVAFGKWAWEHRREEYLEFLAGLAAKECRHGPREIPGVKVHEDRKAV